MGILDILAGASGGLASAAQGQYQRELQRQELARRQARDGMRQQLQMAQLAGYQRQADQVPIDAERQARMDAQAAQDKQFEQAKGLLGLMLQGKQYDAVNDFTQGNDSLRRMAGLNPGQAGPVNMGFAAPPVSADTAARTGAQVQTAQIRAATPRAPQRAPQPRYVTNDQGQRVPDGPGVRVPARGAGGGAKPKSDRELALEVKDEMTGLAPDSFASSEEKLAYNKAFNARLTAKKRARDTATGGGGKPALTPGQQAIIDALKGK